MSLPKITRRDNPLPPVREEEDPYLLHYPDRPRIFRHVHWDGSRELFFGDRRILSVRREEALSLPFLPYVILDTDNGLSYPIGKRTDAEYHWLRESIRRIPQ